MGITREGRTLIGRAEVVRRSAVGQLGALILVTGTVRLAFAAVLPPRFYSIDIHIWEAVSRVLLAGGNPYATTSLLYYPPLWMQILYVLGRISVHTHITLAHLIQVFLTGVDLVIVTLAYLFMRSLGVGKRAFWIALVGIALNPISIVMAVEHGNFDSMVGLSALATVFALVLWSRGAAPSIWLVACLTLGLGILTKTVPLILSPLLLVSWRATDWAARAVAAALVTGPALVGVSVIYALSPRQVAADLFQYRSAAGYFGVSGLLNLVVSGQAATAYSQVYAVIALTVVVVAALAVARARALSDFTIVLGGVLLLMWIPPLGSGYGAQYIGWFLPLGVVLFAISAGPLRVSLIVFAGVALVTYGFEYAFIPAQSPSVHGMLSPATVQTLFRLPLFLAYVGVLVVALGTLFKSTNTGFEKHAAGLPLGAAPTPAPPDRP